MAGPTQESAEAFRVQWESRVGGIEKSKMEVHVRVECRGEKALHAVENRLCEERPAGVARKSEQQVDLSRG